ncbi:hypothetical protein HFN_0977 [Helicobacter fennelliae MRY12-0050]|uniref:Uncharacterized protein n=1 Tax=Helicobacter fennelliae MRY12-0050 TaxID=1325130 RepID=T1DWV1_9HELI|nr:hypothetical protein HFN_0977 [Helicobacter fennelliae MRY12-0050]
MQNFHFVLLFIFLFIVFGLFCCLICLFGGLIVAPLRMYRAKDLE